MWRRLIKGAGIDDAQWWALTRTALTLDFRVSGFGGSALNQQGTTGWQAVLGVALFYVMTGVAFALLAAFSRDVFFSGTIFLTYVMFMVGLALVIDYHSVVISPDDYQVLGFQPVDSRTYFAARVASVIVYVAALTTALGIAPIIAYTFFARGVSPVLGVAAMLATYGTSIATALALVFVYAEILRVVPVQRLKRVLTYAQALMSFAVYGGVMLAGPLVERRAIVDASLAKTPWLFLHPATWFASYLDLAVGRTGIAELGPALLSIAALVMLARLTTGRLSLDYAERLGSMMATSESRSAASAAPRRALWFTRDEPRAVALLVRNQFKYDQKFRMAVLAIAPMTVVYLFLAIQRGGLTDPFELQSRADRTPMLYLAILLFPVILNFTLTRSDTYRASWIYYTCPTDIPRLVTATKNFVMAYFVLPYFAVIALVFMYFVRDFVHVAIHLATLALVSHLFLQLAVLVTPDLPFSRPLRRGERSGLMAVVMIGLSVVSVVSMLAVRQWVYPSAFRTFLLVAALVALTAGFERLIVSRVQRAAERWEYLG